MYVLFFERHCQDFWEDVTIISSNKSTSPSIDVHAQKNNNLVKKRKRNIISSGPNKNLRENWSLPRK